MKTTGEKIREGRANLGITQTELAEKIGVTLRTMAMYRRKIRNSSSRQSPRLILPTSSVPARSSPARIIRNKPDHLCVYGLLDTPFGTFMLYDRLFYF